MNRIRYGKRVVTNSYSFDSQQTYQTEQGERSDEKRNANGSYQPVFIASAHGALGTSYVFGVSLLYLRRLWLQL